MTELVIPHIAISNNTFRLMKKNNRKPIRNLERSFATEAGEREYVYKLHCATAEDLFESHTQIVECCHGLNWVCEGVTESGKSYVLSSAVEECHGVREFVQRLYGDADELVGEETA